MIDQTDKERLVRLETDVAWIKGALGRIEESLQDHHNHLDAHIEKYRAGSSSNGSNGGITIVVGKKTVGLIATLPLAGVVTGVLGYLRSIGLLG